jgi:predicted RNA methylase
MLTSTSREEETKEGTKRNYRNAIFGTVTSGFEYLAAEEIEEKIWRSRIRDNRNWIGIDQEEKGKEDEGEGEIKQKCFVEYEKNGGKVTFEVPIERLTEKNEKEGMLMDILALWSIEKLFVFVDRKTIPSLLLMEEKKGKEKEKKEKKAQKEKKEQKEKRKGEKETQKQQGETKEEKEQGEGESEEDIKEEPLREIKQLAHDLMISSKWRDSMDLWQSLQNIQKVGKNNSSSTPSSSSSPLKFRVTSKRGGVHSFSSTDLAASFASGLEGMKTESSFWEADLKEYDIEIMIHLTFSVLTVGFGVSSRSTPSQHSDLSTTSPSTETSSLSLSTSPLQSNSKLIQYYPHHHLPSWLFSNVSLKPSIAYCLSRLADIRSGELVIDVCTGTGTIPIVSSQHSPRALYLFGDISSTSLEKAKSNSTQVLTSSNLETLQWDCGSLPLRTGIVDCIIANLPFGKRVGSHQHNRDHLYPRLFREITRVLNPLTGRAVLLTTEKQLIVQNIRKVCSYSRSCSRPG